MSASIVAAFLIPGTVAVIRAKFSTQPWAPAPARTHSWLCWRKREINICRQKQKVWKGVASDWKGLFLWNAHAWFPRQFSHWQDLTKYLTAANFEIKVKHCGSYWKPEGHRQSKTQHLWSAGQSSSHTHPLCDGTTLRRRGQWPGFGRVTERRRQWSRQTKRSAVWSGFMKMSGGLTDRETCTFQREAVN